jgi:hypothetical protein
LLNKGASAPFVFYIKEVSDGEAKRFEKPLLLREERGHEKLTKLQKKN